MWPIMWPITYNTMYILLVYVALVSRLWVSVALGVDQLVCYPWNRVSSI